MAQYELSKEQVDILTQLLKNVSIKVDDAPKIEQTIRALQNPIKEEKKEKDT